MASKPAKPNVSPRKYISSKEAAKIREQKLKAMLAALPVMSHKEVRRHRVEYHRALCCELEEEGYFSASRLIYNLVEIDEERRKRAGPNSVIVFLPELKNQNDMLDCLKEGLKQAEKEERRVKKTQRALSMLENARSISMGKLWKLPDLRALDPHTDIPEATEADATEDEKEERAGKFWTIELDSPGTVGTVYQETCKLLHKTLLQMAKEVKRKIPLSDSEVRLCLKALRRAKESETVDVQLEALNALGICYMERDDLKTAISYFEHLLKLSTQNEIWVGICDAHQNLGNVYSRLKSIQKALYHFNELCKAAKSSGSNSLLGRAYRCLGEFHLLSNDPDQASNLLEASFNEYYLQHQKEMLEVTPITKKLLKIERAMIMPKSQDHDIQKQLLIEYERLKEEGNQFYYSDTSRAQDQTRALSAIAKGLKHLPLHADIVLQSDTNRKAMKVLLDWRGNGIPFWESSITQETEKILPTEEFSIPSPQTSDSSITLPDISSSEDLGVDQTEENIDDLYHFPPTVVYNTRKSFGF